MRVVGETTNAGVGLGLFSASTSLISWRRHLLSGYLHTSSCFWLNMNFCYVSEMMLHYPPNVHCLVAQLRPAPVRQPEHKANGNLPIHDLQLLEIHAVFPLVDVCHRYMIAYASGRYLLGKIFGVVNTRVRAVAVLCTGIVDRQYYAIGRVWLSCVLGLSRSFAWWWRELNAGGINNCNGFTLIDV